ncbi:thiamine phosphate synthase [Niallia sp. Sow4_A1]|jgi:thiazole tautomerase (transcriptional regulator TenI)|uniref:thiamine phosphate synthase n=1 Tax=Bacillaceae TaxID=186817 RepID=UPI001E4D6CCC|nr:MULTISPECIES: thiamine phosphate synthase [Bacillaceae]MCM3364676.1 thiamine phosphate synthase [Niallia sp. MER TA 168]
MNIKIMAVTDNKHTLKKLLSILLEIHPYVDYLQIREKDKSPKEIYRLCDYLLKEGVPARKIIVNDRLDIALLHSLKNVHLPTSGVSVNDVKTRFPKMYIGVSVHSKEEAILADKEIADYVIYGHCYPTNSKKGKPPIVLSSISEIKRNISIPLYAIGGITENQIEELASFGVDGVAIMSAIFSSSDPLKVVQSMRERCEELGNEEV